MAWTAWLLAVHLADQGRVADEIAGARRSPWLRAAMSAGLRLPPPGAKVMRDAREPLRAGDHDIPAGALVLVSSYALHRALARWAAPDDFRRGRFGPGAPRVIQGAYLPFSAVLWW
jgi:cytochrome P450